MHSIPPTIAPEAIACIAEGREPTSAELERVARRIHSELTGAQPAFAWGESGSDSSVDLVSRRLAEATLRGSRT
ncbi:hypothetical protein ACNFJ7_11280 [Sphingomonas sp. HT-1]|uniref:hypothetical protein n=1 Tax=unclassified Sphingomonas TaxID=196159 RepID=UPI0002EC274F|nr:MULTISPECIES: hypothetical protein [unclassified Sphingomonas]KTF70492.1 hypothetical protein ATB93_04470 [Sphingomonas sp. WG]